MMYMCDIYALLHMFGLKWENGAFFNKNYIPKGEMKVEIQELVQW